MASNPPGKCCTEFVYHEGSPEGSHKTLYGLDTYVTGTSSDKYIVILTDIYGNKFNNVLLIADLLAKRSGFKVYIPDILKNDPLKNFAELAEWRKLHSPEITRPIVDGFLGKLREDVGSSAFVGVIGYCFGAKYALHQITESGPASAAAIAHPSFVDIEEVAAIRKPILISAAETDQIFPAELRHQTEEKLIEIKATYLITLFGGVLHGYAVRADVTDPKVKYAMNKTLQDQILFFLAASEGQI